MLLATVSFLKCTFLPRICSVKKTIRNIKIITMLFPLNSRKDLERYKFYDYVIKLRKEVVK